MVLSTWFIDSLLSYPPMKSSARILMQSRHHKGHEFVPNLWDFAGLKDAGSTLLELKRQVAQAGLQCWPWSGFWFHNVSHTFQKLVNGIPHDPKWLYEFNINHIILSHIFSVDQFFGLKQETVFLLFGSQIRTGGTSKFWAQELDCPTFLISLLSNGMKLQTSEASRWLDPFWEN